MAQRSTDAPSDSVNTCDGDATASARVKIEQHGSVRVLRWHRPEKRNAITAAMYAEMANLLVAADTDPAVRILVLMGSDKAFSAGNDVEDFILHPPLGEDAPVLRFLAAISTCAKPLLAAVCGVAAGVGSTMLLHCDLVYASEDARFSFPFTQLGLCPEAASSLLLPQLMGHQRAAELLLWGDAFSAGDAHRLGIVNRIFEKEKVESALLVQAQRLAQLPANAVMATKALLKSATMTNISARIKSEATQFADLLQQPAAQEAFNAFVQRRPPQL